MVLNDDILIALGLILKPRGLFGELLIRPYQARSRNLRPGLPALIKTPDKEIHAAIKAVNFVGKRVFVKFDGIDDREKAEACIQGELFGKRCDLLPTEPDEYFVFDLVGLRVTDRGGSEIGKVREIITLPANDVLVVDTAKGEVLVPFVKKYVIEVSIEKQSITIDGAEGFITNED